MCFCSQTWFDSSVLAGLFAHLLHLLEQGTLDSTLPAPMVTVVYESGKGVVGEDMTLLEAANGNGNGCTKECPVCTKQVMVLRACATYFTSTSSFAVVLLTCFMIDMMWWLLQFILAGYPAAFSIAPKKSARRKSDTNASAALVSAAEWCWLCPTCVQALSGHLAGCEIKVWWDGDSRYYKGVIEEFDAVSGRHRVQYDGSEWEFVKLEREGYCVHLPADRLARLVSALERVDTKKTGSSSSTTGSASTGQDVDAGVDSATSSSRKRARR